jgi:MFS family permease
VFSVVASLVAYVAIPETHVESGTRKSVKPWDVDTSTAAVTVGMINFAVLFVYIGALFATLVLFLGANDISVLGFAEQGTSGVFMAVTVVAAGVFMFGGGYLSDRRQSRVPTLVVFLVVTVVGFVLLAYASSLVTVTVACLFIGAGQGGTSGPLMALLSDLTPDERMGRAIGTNNVLGDVGAGLGPILTLPLVNTVGFKPVYLTCAAFPLLAVAILLAGIYRETGRFRPAVDLDDT